MEKTLYLNENTTLNVTRDGPSIVVNEGGKSYRRVPARMIQRVIITGNIKLETSIITLFTQNNVPVTFFDKQGNQIAVALPYKQYLPGHYRVQRIFLESDYSGKRFMTFLLAYRQRIQVDVLRRLMKRHLLDKYLTVGLKEEEYRQAIDNITSTYREKFQRIRSAISAVFNEMIISALIAAELDLHMGIMHKRQDFGFVRDICYILDPEIDLQAIQHISGRKGFRYSTHKEITPEEIKEIAVRFENRKEALVNMTEHIIDGIFELGRELRIGGESGRY